MYPSDLDTVFVRIELPKKIVETISDSNATVLSTDEVISSMVIDKYAELIAESAQVESAQVRKTPKEDN